MKSLKLINDDESFLENSYIDLTDLDIKNIGHLEALRLMLLKKITGMVMQEQSLGGNVFNRKFNSFGNK